MVCEEEIYIFSIYALLKGYSSFSFLHGAANVLSIFLHAQCGVM